MKHDKRTKAGQDVRLDALAGFVDRDLVRELMKRTRGDSGVAKDEILDALALCRSKARFALNRHGTLPAALLQTIG